MISCLLVVLGAGSALGGVSIQMPYLHPAGVTYSHLAPAVPAIPSHLQYASATRSSVAYGNPAFFGGSYTPTAVQYAAAPVAHVATPIAAPVVPTVHHVPAVAQVPITKYEAQPAVIQNLVDVAKPKLATRKIEIRRPAIQKEFYDVEERVVIRPAGSAVVELDQPISKSQKGLTVVQPAVHTVAAPVLGVRALHSHHHVVPAAYPGSVSLHPYPLQGPFASYPVHSTPAPTQEFVTQPEEIPQQTQDLTQQEQPEAVSQQEPEAVPQPDTQPIPEQQPQQFDDSDSVAVDNPDIARVRSQNQPEQPNEPITRGQNFFRINSPLNQQPQFFQQQQQFAQQQQQYAQQQQERFTNQQQHLFAPSQVAQQRSSSQQNNIIARSQLLAQEQVVAQLQAQTQAQQAQLQRSQQFLEVHQQELQRSRQVAEAPEMRNQPQQLPESQTQPIPQSRTQADQNERSNLASSRPLENVFDISDIRNALINNVARSSNSPSVIPSFRISPEQSLTNQERLISLLTARGNVVEAQGNFAGVRNQEQPSGPNQVRARVISVTPAPERSAPSEEKVNTRRIVVSRPIQTVEEVSVVEPFTKIERVAVHSPALIKTARVGLAHVPTSLPVHGYAHAISAATIPAY